MRGGAHEQCIRKRWTRHAHPQPTPARRAAPAHCVQRARSWHAASHLPRGLKGDRPCCLSSAPFSAPRSAAGGNRPRIVARTSLLHAKGRAGMALDHRVTCGRCGRAGVARHLVSAPTSPSNLSRLTQLPGHHRGQQEVHMSRRTRRRSRGWTPRTCIEGSGMPRTINRKGRKSRGEPLNLPFPPRETTLYIPNVRNHPLRARATEADFGQLCWLGTAGREVPPR